MNDPRSLHVTQPSAGFAAEADPALDAKLAALAEALRATAAERDRAGGHAAHEKQLIAEAGLLALPIPKRFGGPGASWPVAYRAVRALARVDGALAHLTGFTWLQLAGVELWGSDAQREQYLRGTAEHAWWWGNAVNPLDTRAVARADGRGGFRVSGTKSFCSGTRGSEYLTINALNEATGQPLFAVVPTARAGIVVNDDWDPIGQRQTDSGSVSFTDVEVSAAEVLHRTDPPTPRETLRTPLSQLVLTNLFVGLAEGALDEARRYLREHGRPWINSGVGTVADDPYLQLRFGRLHVQTLAAAVLADRAAEQFDAAWNRGAALTAEGRAQAALAVSEAKIAAHGAALDVGEQVFDACGARATGAALGLDRFWRNARVHTLHDPLDYRIRDVGRYVLTGELPEPTLYT